MDNSNFFIDGDIVVYQQDEITIDDRGTYLRIVVCGTSNLEKVITSIDEADQIFQEKPFSKLLYDFRTMYGRVNAVDKIRIGLYAARFRYYGLKVAVLCLPAQTQTLRFLETYLQDRGVLFRLFTNEDQALQWFVA